MRNFSFPLFFNETKFPPALFLMNVGFGTQPGLPTNIASLICIPPSYTCQFMLATWLPVRQNLAGSKLLEPMRVPFGKIRRKWSQLCDIRLNKEVGMSRLQVDSEMLIRILAGSVNPDCNIHWRRIKEKKACLLCNSHPFFGFVLRA